MSLFSQNKKIAVAALSIFIVSFSIMVFFLDGHKLDHDNGHASILDSHHEQERTCSIQRLRTSLQQVAQEASEQEDISR